MLHPYNLYITENNGLCMSPCLPPPDIFQRKVRDQDHICYIKHFIISLLPIFKAEQQSTVTQLQN